MTRRFAPWTFWLALVLLLTAFVYFSVSGVLLAIVGVIASAILLYRARGVWLRARFIRNWGPEGKDLLLVYSNSPHWQEYIETRWLPLLGPRAVVLNWSERATWREKHRLEGEIARRWGGDREFNPLALVIQPGLPVRVVRFWQAFRDRKHGTDRALQGRERELGELLGIPFPAE